MNKTDKKIMLSMLFVGFLIVTATFIAIHLSSQKGYKRGYEAGLDVGITAALVRVQKLVDEQVEENAKDGKLTGAVFNDTVIYYLSPKTIKDELHP